MNGRKILRFGVFELDSRSGELRKHGVRIRLRGKPLQILLTLAEAHGEVVTREELRQRLWPSDVFVDFDSGLNTAANRLRLALGDSAEHPRYIETLARTGYRFIAPVDTIEVTAGTRETRYGRQLAAAAAIGGIVVSASAVWLLRQEPGATTYEFRQITYRRGQVGGSRFAPDGETVIYTANWDQQAPHLFLTHPSSPESRVRWRRLGLDVAYARESARGKSREFPPTPFPGFSDAQHQAGRERTVLHRLLFSAEARF